MRTEDPLKKPYEVISYTKEELIEIQKCLLDPVYFCQKYVYIQHPIRGKLNFEMYDYQKAMLKTIHEHQSSIILAGRQLGKTQTVASYLLWRALFIPDQTILIAANKLSQAMEVTHKIRSSYVDLPHWIKAGVKQWNKGEIEFDNGSRIIARATTPDAGRGLAVSLLYIDEFAFVPPNMAKDFWSAMSPTLSTGGKCVVSSTPNSDEDKFAELWHGAMDNIDSNGNLNPGGLGRNGFKGFKAIWSDHPDRDEAWAERERNKIGVEKFLREHEVEFIQNEETLISGMKLKNLCGCNPIYQEGQVRWYHKIEPGHSYAVGLDPSAGTGGDYSAVQVFRLPDLVQVAEWKDNRTTTREQVRLLQSILKKIRLEMINYKKDQDVNIYWSVENNTIGEGALMVIEDTGEERFPGIMINEPKRRGLSRVYRKGLNTSKKSKLIACSQLKSLLETDRITISSHSLVSQLKNFVRRGDSFAAKPGTHDDLVMSLLLVIRIAHTVRNWEQGIEEHLNESVSEDDGDSYQQAMPVLL